MAKLPLTKILITFSIYCCVFANGICSNIYGPTWLDLANLLQKSIGALALSISIRAMFFCAGAIIGGFIYRLVDRGALYPIFILTKGLCVALIPLYADYVAFLFFSGVIGLVSGAADTSVNVWILDIWAEHSAPFVQALQFFWAVGFIVSPLISNPFLSPEGRQRARGNLTTVAATTTTVSTLTTETTVTEFVEGSLEPIAQERSLLYIPYGIAGALCLIGSVSLLLIYLYKRISKICKQNLDEELEKKNDKKSADSSIDESPELEKQIEYSKSKAYMIPILLFTCVMTSVFCASEMTTFQYIPTYCVKLNLGLTKSDASLVMTGVAISFAIGRFMGILCAIRYKPQHILWFDWLIILVGNLILLFSHYGPSYLWSGSLLIGFGYASFFAAVFSFLKERIAVNNLISSIIILSSLSGNALGFPVLIGKYIDQYPIVMIYGNIACLVVMLLCFIGLIWLDCKYGVRSRIQDHFKKQQQQLAEKNELKQ